MLGITAHLILWHATYDMNILVRESATVTDDISLNDDGIDVVTSGPVYPAVLGVSCNEPIDAPDNWNSCSL